jgi:hypothetical protein
MKIEGRGKEERKKERNIVREKGRKSLKLRKRKK